jgi:hypothetical protein
LTAVIETEVIMPVLKQQLLCLATLAVAGQLAGVSSAPETERLINKAYVDSSGTVHVVEHSGSDKSIPKEKDQVGASMLKITVEKKTAGWTAEYANCCTSYPIPMTLVIYHDGRIRHRLHDGMMIYDWKFWAHGRQIAFCTGTTHGRSTGHCELHDVESGRTLATVEPRRVVADPRDYKYPPWAQSLQK